MANLKKLEKIVDQTMGETIVWDSKMDNIYHENGIFDVLIFPRNKLIMEKRFSGNWMPESWFINKRTNEKVTEIEKPTEINHEGLTSGYRAAIIKTKNNKYLKLKGVASSIFPKKMKDRGICDFWEAIKEQIYAASLDKTEIPQFEGIKPAFVELYNNPKDNCLKKFIEAYQVPKQKLELMEKDSFRNIRKYSEFYKKNITRLDNLDFSFVSAVQILGDTRLDEATWHMTKNPLSGEKKQVRDELLKFLFYRAGIAKAALTMSGYAWGQDFNNTNSHIGNFNIYPIENRMMVGISDIGGMKANQDFDNTNEFQAHTKKELEDFEWDINEKATMSPTIQLKYRYFSKNLRSDCFNALKTGYYTALLVDLHISNILWQIEQPEKVIVPKKIFFHQKDFKEQLDYVMS